MKRVHPHLKTPLSLCLGLVLLASPMFAADIANVQMDSDGILWQPATNAASWVLTVTGPDGYYVRQEFDSAPSLGLFTADGQFLADGLYKYELQAIPRISFQLRQELDAAAGDLELRERLAARVQGLAGVQSGHFRIFQGALVQDDQVELPAPGGGVMVPNGDLAVSQTVPEGSLDHTQVINMDLVVQGSICVGFDCPNSPSFGADTLRLQENNLRIHFDDTSNSASFPNNDWRLIANDSTNGGANKFVVQDATAGREVFTIEAGTISNALYVDSAGDVGIGTSSPVVEVHAVDGNTPTLRLEQNGSSGFTPQTWDVAGNETNFFVRDVTNGSKLPFRIRPGAPDSSIDIEGTGDVGFGTASPSAPIHVRRTSGTAKLFVEEAIGTTGNRDLMELSNNGPVTARYTDSSSGRSWGLNLLNGGFAISLNGSGVNELLVQDDGDVIIQGTLTQNSDRRTKHQITAVEPQDVLARVAALPISTWVRKSDVRQAIHMGPMAQDFAELFGLGINDTSISSLDMAGVSLAAVQGLMDRVEELKSEKEALAERLANLEQMLQQVLEDEATP